MMAPPPARLQEQLSLSGSIWERQTNRADLHEHFTFFFFKMGRLKAGGDLSELTAAVAAACTLVINQ